MDVTLALQPFYSTERITELVKDVEQDLQKILGEEQGVQSICAGTNTVAAADVWGNSLLVCAGCPACGLHFKPAPVSTWHTKGLHACWPSVTEGL